MTEAISLNAIEMEVIYESTLQIARELTVDMQRTGYSTILKESQDFTFAIFDGRARMVAQGVPQPVHIDPISAQVKGVHETYRGRLEPGDAIVVNHAYRTCQNHATDLTLIVARGYVTKGSAREDYGVALTGEGQEIDWDTTRALRGESVNA